MDDHTYTLRLSDAWVAKRRIARSAKIQQQVQRERSIQLAADVARQQQQVIAPNRELAQAAAREVAQQQRLRQEAVALRDQQQRFQQQALQQAHEKNLLNEQQLAQLRAAFCSASRWASGSLTLALLLLLKTVGLGVQSGLWTFYQTGGVQQ